MVVVKKKDGSNRVCVDYPKLNRITVTDPEPMTTAEDLFQKLGQCQFFSKIDLSKGYWQIPVADEDIYKTAFVKVDGCYECRRMPFGIREYFCQYCFRLDNIIIQVMWVNIQLLKPCSPIAVVCYNYK